MPEQIPVRSESSGPDAGGIHAAPGEGVRGSPGGLAAYYRLRCIALEARVARLEAELDRANRELQEVVTRYEEVLQHRKDATLAVSRRS